MTLVATPARALADVPVVVEARGLAPHFGGTRRVTALAKTELWPRILHFLDDHAQ